MWRAYRVPPRLLCHLELPRLRHVRLDERVVLRLACRRLCGRLGRLSSLRPLLAQALLRGQRLRLGKVPLAEPLAMAQEVALALGKVRNRLIEGRCAVPPPLGQRGAQQAHTLCAPVGSLVRRAVHDQRRQSRERQRDVATQRMRCAQLCVDRRRVLHTLLAVRLGSPLTPLLLHTFVTPAPLDRRAHLRRGRSKRELDAPLHDIEPLARDGIDDTGVLGSQVARMPPEELGKRGGAQLQRRVVPWVEAQLAYLRGPLEANAVQRACDHLRRLWRQHTPHHRTGS